MRFRELFHSKCPNCKKHGIPWYKTARYHRPTLVCNKCGTKYKANVLLAVILTVLAALLIGFIDIMLDRFFNVDLDTTVAYIIAFIELVAIQYFLPIEKVDE